MQVDPDQSAELTAIQQVIARNILLPLFERSSQAIIVLDAADLRIVAANGSARAALSGNMRLLRRLRLPDVLTDLPADRVARFLRLFAGLRRNAVRVRIRTTGVTPRYYDVDVARMVGRDPTIVLQVQDITDIQSALKLAETAEARLLTAIDTLSDGFALFDADDRLVLCNDTYRLLHPDGGQLIQPGIRFEDILKFGTSRGLYADAIGREDEWIRQHMNEHRTLPGPIEHKLSNGRWLRIVERKTPDGGRVGLRVDVTTLKEQQNALRRMATTDELTGLRNRRNLLEDIAVMSDGLEPGEVIVIFHMDLDRFKAVNDVYGHDAGDHVLKHCAALLESAVPPQDVVARVGGDEFIIARRMPAERSDMTAFAEQLIGRMVEPIGYAGQFMHIGASIGIAILDLNIGMGTRGTVLTEADLALYEAKKIGSAAVFFKPHMRDQIQAANVLARELQHALERHEFEAYFQPQIDVPSATCIGFEALLRWNHPRRGVLSAGQFLEVAQRAGLTDALDTFMLDAACRALRWMADQGWHALSVSINLSTTQLSDPRLLQRLQAALADHKVARQQLHIELLESTLLDERTSHFLANVQAMVDAGFVVELDDFGTGHAAIASLRKFHVSQIKIDRSFVRHIDSDQELQKLTGAIVGLAHSLDISILAEGVETAAEQACLLRMGCHLAQGWHYEKAMPLGLIGTFLAQYPAATTGSAYRRGRSAASAGPGPGPGHSLAPARR